MRAETTLSLPLLPQVVVELVASMTAVLAAVAAVAAVGVAQVAQRPAAVAEQETRPLPHRHKGLVAEGHQALSWAPAAGVAQVQPGRVPAQEVGPQVAPVLRHLFPAHQSLGLAVGAVAQEPSTALLVAQVALVVAAMVAGRMALRLLDQQTVAVAVVAMDLQTE